ncbi:MAG: ROK family protein, partial [Pseudomonadota bacterium]
MRVDGEHGEVWRGSARSDDVRRFNRRRVLRCVRRAREISRTGVAELTGLSPATVTAIASDLMSAGLLEEAAPSMGVRRTGRGRPTTNLSLNARASSVAIVNLQLDTITGAIIDYTGQTIGSGSCRIATRSASRAKLRAGLASVLQSAISDAGRKRPRIGRVCVAAQGVTDVGCRILTWSPVTKSGGLEIAEWIEDDFGVSTDVRNDAGLAALGLNARAPETYSDAFAVVLLAHGVGMGLFLNGQLVQGGLSSGTEFGHMIHQSGGAKCRCGVSGCIEAYAGDYAILRRADGRDVTSQPTRSVSLRDIEAVGARVASGDAMARAAIDEAGRAIG